jgi:hypothetical protein
VSGQQRGESARIAGHHRHPRSGALAFVTAPDWEQPSDLFRDNLYKILVSVIDGRGGRLRRNEPDCGGEVAGPLDDPASDM